mmetsp:Transcript_954/g.2273  ORF Transcript_954/g.2273 Transcript_954/m.2273 type:complete len:227 (+) Transcript_954:174-854(+)
MILFPSMTLATQFLLLPRDHIRRLCGFVEGKLLRSNRGPLPFAVFLHPVPPDLLDDLLACGAGWHHTRRIVVAQVVQQHLRAVLGTPQRVELEVTELGELQECVPGIHDPRSGLRSRLLEGSASRIDSVTSSCTCGQDEWSDVFTILLVLGLLCNACGARGQLQRASEEGRAHSPHRFGNLLAQPRLFPAAAIFVCAVCGGRFALLFLLRLALATLAAGCGLALAE